GGADPHGGFEDHPLRVLHNRGDRVGGRGERVHDLLGLAGLVRAPAGGRGRQKGPAHARPDRLWRRLLPELSRQGPGGARPEVHAAPRQRRGYGRRLPLHDGRGHRRPPLRRGLRLPRVPRREQDGGRRPHGLSGRGRIRHAQAPRGHPHGPRYPDGLRRL
ncbi:MAG: hypothetical protein AVDCRST_MAG25-691, partial [uncultured Rubrobacteraceae bacterium]